MTTLPISADGQAIALVCSSLATAGDRSGKPLTAGEWHELSLTMRASGLRPRDLLGSGADELRATLGLPAALGERLAGLLARGGQLALEVERLAGVGIWTVTRADDAYPPELKRRLGGQAPPVLFGAGPQTALQLRSIAVVGSRDVDTAGLAFASSLGRRCAEQGYVVVSGAARGVDLAAMTGSLAQGGQVVGVTVDPLDRLVRRRDLRLAIADELLTLTTPFHPSTRWYAGNAMRRNALIYALAQAAVVVASSAVNGGTRSGAVENLRAGWVALHVRDDGSPGNSRLIGEGGIPLSAEQPIEQLDLGRLTTAPRPSLFDQRGPGEESGPRGARAAVDAPDPTDGPSPTGRSSPTDRPSLTDRPSPTDRPASPRPVRAEDARIEAAVPEAAVPEAADVPAICDDAFDAVWPLLARHLLEPRSEREVAERVGLELGQARAWLKRAVADGRAELELRPKRYVLPSEGRQLRLDG